MNKNGPASPGNPPAKLAQSESAAQLDRLLSEARNRLIDTGSRNRLVHTNRRAKRPATLAILHPDADALFRQLVHTGASQRFRSDPNATARESRGGAGDDIPTDDAPLSGLTIPLANGVLQTRSGENALQKRLLKFSRDAKTLEEEQGINILYLAIGFLRWFEDETSEVSREAPLILVPVSLLRDPRRSTFDLKARDDDITLNLPLAERLGADFGITLPPIPDDDIVSAATYLSLVEEIVASRPRWSIDRTGIELGFFSFAKLLMFHDLAGDAWPEKQILTHPLLQGLMQSGFAEEREMFPDDTKIDERFAPADLLHVVDADGSQTLVIETVRSGRNLVVQGPPGTGKSQTIANILAAAAHDGKKVLFIAEKMVALNVVHKRLERIGLSPLCLELHSRTANKKWVSEELGRTLATGHAVPNVTASAERLKAARDHLNVLSARLHVLIDDTGMTPFKALGDLVRARGLGRQPAELDLPRAAVWRKSDYERLVATLSRLVSETHRAGRMDSHPWRAARNTTLQPPDIARLTQRLEQALASIARVIELTQRAASEIGVEAPPTLAAAKYLLNQLDRGVITIPHHSSALILHIHALSGAERARVSDLLASVQTLSTETRAAEGIFTVTALDAATSAIRATLAGGSASFWIRFGGAYRRAVAELAAWHRTPVPKQPAARVELVDRLLKLQTQRKKLEDHHSEANNLLGVFYAGEQTDFIACVAALDWLNRASRLGLAANLSQVLNYATKGGDAARDGEQLRSNLENMQSHIEAIFQNIDLDVEFLFGFGSIDAVRIHDLQSIISKYSLSIDRYAEWLALRRSHDEVCAANAVDLAQRIADGRLVAAEAIEELRHARAESLWKEAISKDRNLTAIDGSARSALVAEFQNLDVARRKATAALILAQHIAKMPRGALGDMAVIRGEIARQRGRMAIRKLMDRAGRTIQEIKPIFLMSPISAAQFLPPGKIEFDLLVFDEASQVRPEDALGVIARAKQVVVVGDRKQLPPTSFFSRLLADDTDDDDDDASPDGAIPAAAAPIADLESILTLCEARGIHSRMLRWHYRSRHHSLVEVSNAEFYGSSLVLPPAPTTAREKDGLVVRRVAGAYDRGGKRTNAIEAQAVVDAAEKHAKDTPDRSLGIVTFSMVQRDLVSTLLDERRRGSPELDAFLADTSREEVFVKNLENVQGDERDAIFISVGYGPRQSGGRLDSMSFGPVSSEGGERRLNVLFTRARFRCELFVSFDSGDIDLTRATGIGPRVLKRFLAYAETGIIDQPTVPDADYDSPFEEDVANVVRSIGYPLVDAQVGSAGFKLDLGVRDPERPGRYLLAIECDGATYHAALWARERDRMRQEILESLGWQFHRIWSTDWFYRRQAEIDRLSAALQAARKHEPIAQPPAPQPVPEPTPPPVAPPPALSSKPYVLATFSVSGEVEPHKVSPTEMADIVWRIVSIEGPINTTEVARRVATLFGKDRTGARITKIASEGLDHALRTNSSLRMEADFWFTVEQAADCPLRDRSLMPISLQRAEMLPPLEIKAAARVLLDENGAVSPAQLSSGIARLLGFQRTGPDLLRVICGVLSDQVKSGEVLRENGMFRLATPAT